MSLPMPKGYEIDDKDLSDYGVVVLQGSNAEILKAPTVKRTYYRILSVKTEQSTMVKL